ncbi:hypothetical protein P4K71_26445 [Bacillus cereus]|uniref:hypothetical protein n=1 Tax=Bacillus cereus group TaxID=86661 RepID=UPI000BF475D3|nr:hypothetical protein [Bacillus thuringiensis]MEB8740776.1 hypothetical protein [Bacillus cereus]MEB8909565.1 hypothetical protein [Bacillus cereus]MEB9926284.1 hypothetical protein [Bacillus cereus]MEB9986883.1 hypothetical protein [Bacillus cereus]MEB9992065.1 hypothetical protein [Bacillus cereus]
MPKFILGVAEGTPLFDVSGMLGKFVADYGATVKDAAPIIIGASLLVIGLVKGIGLVKKLASKVG